MQEEWSLWPAFPGPPGRNRDCWCVLKTHQHDSPGGCMTLEREFKSNDNNSQILLWKQPVVTTILVGLYLPNFMCEAKNLSLNPLGQKSSISSFFLPAVKTLQEGTGYFLLLFSPSLNLWLGQAWNENHIESGAYSKGECRGKENKNARTIS